MATYVSDMVIGTAIFAGFTTTLGQATNSLGTPIYASTAASKAAFFKGGLVDTAAGGIIPVAGPIKFRYSGIAVAAGVYMSQLSFVRIAAYTAPMTVSGGNIIFDAGTNTASIKYWIDAYNSTGTKVGTAGGTVIASNALQNITMPTNQTVQVPAGGYLGMRIHTEANIATVRTFLGSGNASLTWTPIETAGGGGGAVAADNVVENRERFHTSDGTPYPDGSKVYEYNSLTMAYTGRYGIIGDVTGEGVSGGLAGALVAAATGITAISTNIATTKEATSNGSYTFDIVANVGNFDMVLTSPNAVVQTFPSVDVTFTGLVCDDTGYVFDIVGTVAAAVGASFIVTGSGVIADDGVAAAATGVGEVVFTRANSDTAEYFYVIPDPAAGNTWQASTAQILNYRVNPGAIAKLYAKVITAGTAGVAEPTWPTVKGGTVVDGTIVWTMVEVETLVTNAVKGYQLAAWTPGRICTAGTLTLNASRAAPAGSGQYALCSSAPGTGGSVSAFAAGTTGATGITVDTTSPAAALSNGDYTFTSNVGGDLTVTDVANGVAQVFLAAAVAAGTMTKTNTGLIFNLAGTLVAGTGGTFTVVGAAAIISAVSTLGAFAAGTTGVTGLTVDATNVVGSANAGSYTFTSNAAGDVTFIKGAGAAQIVLAAALAAPFILTDGALTLTLTGTPVLGTGGSFQIGSSGGGSAGAVVPVWPTPIVNGVTTVTDGNVVWTMFDDEVYV